MITGENDKGRRLDRILRKALPDCSLSLIHRYLRQGKIKVNGKSAKAQDRPDCGSIISIHSMENTQNIPLSASNTQKMTPAPEILWQGNGLLAVNKPAGIAVHGPDSLDEIILRFLLGKLPPSLSFKPGPLHRLDKPSSGIVVFSTSIEGARLFSALLRERKVRKTYLAITEGIVSKNEIWEDVLVRDTKGKKTNLGVENGKNAITKIMPVSVMENRTLIRAEIETGRTHQIRAQAAAHGYPLAGDKKYGGKKFLNSGKYAANFFLHAWKMEFLNYFIEAPLPSGWPVFPEGDFPL